MSGLDAGLDLAPKPSLRALTWLFWLHTAALALSLWALPEGAPMALSAGAILLSWIWTRRHPAFGFGPRALARLTWHPAGGSAPGWTLHEASGARIDAELEGSSIVHDRLLVLNFRAAGGARRTRVLLGDELDEDLQRRLRARLALARGV